MGKKLLLIGGILAGLLLLSAGLFVWLFDFDETLNAKKDVYLPELEKALGREVEVGHIETSFLPVLGASLHDVVIKGAKPGDAPLLTIAKVEFRADLWTAIRSMGKNVELNALLVDGLVVNLVREADGTLSYDDVVKRLTDGPPTTEAPKPLDPEAKRFIKGLKLKRVALENAEIHLTDKATGGAPAETYVKKLLVEVDNVKLSDPFELHVAAAIFAEQENFDLKVKLGPLPIGEIDVPLPVESIALTADGIALERITPYLGPELPIQIKSARLGAKLEVQDPLAATGRIKVAGRLSLAELAVGNPEPGPAFNLKLEPNVAFDPNAGSLDVTGFFISLDDMVIKAGGRVEGIGSARPSFDRLMVKTENLDLSRVLTLLPDLKRALPPGMELAGPLGLNAQASGDPSAQTVEVSLNLDPVRVLVPGAFDKPAGEPLHLSLSAALTQKDLELKSLDVAVGPLALKASGTVKDFEKPTIDIKADTGSFPLHGLVRLLPSVKQAIPPDVTVQGQLQLAATAKGTPEQLAATVELGIAGANLEVPGAVLKGSGQVKASATGNPQAALSLALNAALSELAIQAGEAFNKPAGVPLVLAVNASKTGSQVQVSNLELKLGPLALTGQGSTDLRSGALDLKVTVPPFKVGELAALLPALKSNPFAAATVGSSAALSGNPKQPATLRASLTGFSFAQGRSSLSGQAAVEDLNAPKIRFEFASSNLDLDELFPVGQAAKEAPAETTKATRGAPPPIVKAIDAAGKLTVARGLAGGFPFTRFVADLSLKGGLLTFNALDFDAYEGHFSAAGTSAQIGEATPSFDVAVALKNVSAKPLLAEQADLKETLSGRMNSTIKVKGRGDAWEAISKTLSGTASFGLDEGRFHGADLEREILVPLAKKVPLIKAPKGPAGTALKDLAAQFTVKDGKLTLIKPMTTTTPQGPLTLDGYIGLDTRLHLKGSLALNPSIIKKASGNRLKPEKPVPVGLTIGGTAEDPEITGVELDELLALLGGALAKQLGLEKLEDAKAKAEALAREKVDAAKKKAEEAKKKAEDAAKKATDTAKKKATDTAKKAEKKAKEEAKKRLQGLF